MTRRERKASRERARRREASRLRLLRRELRAARGSVAAELRSLRKRGLPPWRNGVGFCGLGLDGQRVVVRDPAAVDYALTGTRALSPEALVLLRRAGVVDPRLEAEKRRRAEPTLSHAPISTSPTPDSQR